MATQTGRPVVGPTSVDYLGDTIGYAGPYEARLRAAPPVEQAVQDASFDKWWRLGVLVPFAVAAVLLGQQFLATNKSTHPVQDASATLGRDG